jgi:Uma2 family endonuclease
MAHAPAISADMSREEYEALVERGVLTDAKVELVHGRIVSMTPQGDEHAHVIVTLTRLLAGADGLHVQVPLALGRTSEPEPDLALATRAGYRHPTTARLVVEVVWSQWHEATRKLPVYAEAEIGECWIVDVRGRRVRVHDRPSGRGYARVRTFAGDDILIPPAAGVRFAATDVFAGLDDERRDA